MRAPPLLAVCLIGGCALILGDDFEIVDTASTASTNGAGAGSVSSTGGSGGIGVGGTGGTAPPPPEVLLALGRQHSCVKLLDASIRCWGKDDCGQLGNGMPPPLTACDTTIAPPNSTTPIAVPEIPAATTIAAGFAQTCVTRPDGTARCWGRNNNGQLGSGQSTPLENAPVGVSGLTGTLSVSVGHSVGCAIRDDDTVWCWGLGDRGQLGHGSNVSSNVPVQVVTIDTAVEITVGNYHACARLSGGALRCWGGNTVGQLGDATTANSNVPVEVMSIADALSVSAGANHTCALRADQTVWCWGDNAYGQLGVGSEIDSPVPIPVPDFTGATGVDTGGQFTCATKSDGTAWCWGRNSNGSLGNGVLTPGEVLSPTQVMNIVDFKRVQAGIYHACGVRLDDSVHCWGDNDHGQLGDGSQMPSAVPVQVAPF